MATPNSNMESKNGPGQEDNVKQTAADDISDQAERVDGEDDIIIQHLETTGKDIGFTFRTFLAVVSMGLCYNAYLFSLFIPASMLSFINADLGPDARYTWITISWNLGGAIIVTVAGRLSDIFGRRYFFLTGAVIIFVGSIVAATGTSINQMIASGVVFGIGSGFLEMSFGAVQEIVPNEWRMFTVGCFESSGVIAFTTPIISWVLIDRTGTWRYAYWYMTAFQGLNIIFLFLFYHPPAFSTKHAEDGKTKMQLLKEFDYVGMFLFIAGCALLLIGISSGGSIFPWASAQTLVPIVLGFFLLVALGLYETYATISVPILPPKLFTRVRHFTMPMVVISISGMQYYSNAVLWPRMSQLLYASDNISKGLFAQCLPLGSLIGGFFIMCSKRIGHQRWYILFVIVLQTAAVGAMASSTLDNAPKSIILTIIVSMCTAPAQLISIVMIGFGIEDQQDIGIACGLAGTSRLISGALATAVFSNILSNKYTEVLPATIAGAVNNLNFPSANLSQLVKAAKLGTAAAFKSVPGITPQIQAATILANKLAYLEGFHLVFLVAVGFGCIACIACFFTVSIDERKYTKNTVAILETERKMLEDKEALENKEAGMI